MMCLGVVRMVYSSIQHGVNELFSLEPKDKQVETIQHLLGNRRGPILMANAGSGKSIIFQAPPLIQEARELIYYAVV